MGTGSVESEVRVKAVVLQTTSEGLMLWFTALIPGKRILPNLPAHLHFWVG